MREGMDNWSGPKVRQTITPPPRTRMVVTPTVTENLTPTTHSTRASGTISRSTARTGRVTAPARLADNGFVASATVKTCLVRTRSAT